MSKFKNLVYAAGQLLSGNAGMLAAAAVETFVVNPTSGYGSDDGEGTVDSPLASLAEAHDRCVSGRGDVVILIGGPTSGGTTGQTDRNSSTLTWSKHNTHLIGACAPTKVGQRSRITGPSSGGTFSPLMHVSGSGCKFINFSIFDDYTVDPVALKVTGQRNYFENVNVQGMGAATGADDAAAASLWLAGGSENRFVGCVIGLDTVPRSTSNAEILLSSQATRNVFEGCDIIAYADNAGHLFVSAGASGIDRYTLFRDCNFLNCPTGIASGTTMTQAMNINAAAGGMIILDNCGLVGATDWCAADNGNVFIKNGAPTAGTSGLMVAVTR